MPGAPREYAAQSRCVVCSCRSTIRIPLIGKSASIFNAVSRPELRTDE
ncbi:hypothetical protein RHOER0001_0370 [Rhodococcus erythropolis SK121]|nr:hypothetical protein RHOER0001_0370 [Rhodococcus erythropolis SK121]